MQQRPFLHGSWVLVAGLVGLLASACAKGDRSAHERAPAAVAVAPNAAGAGPSPTAGTPSRNPGDSVRRIIRTAELSVETDAPQVAANKLGALAEAQGGFVVSSETSRVAQSDGAEIVLTTLVFRVPVGAFDDALATVRATGSMVSDEKVNGQDVTEEYVDLESRIRAQRAVEEQYLAVLKDAKSIPDVLAVQQKLGEARTEIERAEGRRRFLESQTSLSTITVHLARDIAAVKASGPGFGRSVGLAWKDTVGVAIAIVNGAIRLMGVLLPVGVLVVAPMWLLVKLSLRRRAKRGLSRPPMALGPNAPGA